MKTNTNPIAVIAFFKLEAKSGRDLDLAPLTSDPVSNAPASQQRKIRTIYADTNWFD